MRIDAVTDHTNKPIFSLEYNLVGMYTMLVCFIGVLDVNNIVIICNLEGSAFASIAAMFAQRELFFVVPHLNLHADEPM